MSPVKADRAVQVTLVVVVVADIASGVLTLHMQTGALGHGDLNVTVQFTARVPARREPDWFPLFAPIVAVPALQVADGTWDDDVTMP